MIILLSPAKTLDYSTPATIDDHSQPEYIKRSAALIAQLRKLRAGGVAALMDLSPALAELNVSRYQAWTPDFTPHNAKQAVLAFDGDVYDGLAAPSMTAADLAYAQQRVRILSGLHGVLRPLDLMLPYRLEMGTRFAAGKAHDLYEYWGKTVTDNLKALLAAQAEPVVVNLASQEYFKVVCVAKLGATVISPVFQDWKNGKYKIISFFAKRARGAMARYAIVNRLDRAEQLKQFDTDGYRYAPDESNQSSWVFRRKLA